MNRYSVSFLGNVTIYAESDDEARHKFAIGEFADELQKWALVDQVELDQKNVNPDSE